MSPNVKANSISKLKWGYFRRKKWIIDPHFQWSFLKYTLSISVIVSLIYFFTIKLFFMKFYKLAEQAQIPSNHIFYEFLDHQTHSLDMFFAGSSLVVLVILFIYGVILSNRVSGPIIKVQKYLKDALNQKYPGKLEFRKDDYFQDLAKTADQCIRKIHGHSKD